MFAFVLKALIGAVVWCFANALYVDMRRKGVRGFGRFAAFWIGTPTTWIWLFMVPEGTHALPAPPPDDEEGLLREVRADRVLRSGGSAAAGSEPPELPDSTDTH